MLQVENLQKSFADFKAVAGANLAVQPGDLVAVIGPNGAGKTTLFNLITGHLAPDRGRILFKGEDVTGLPAYEICRKGIARSFQIANIFPRLSVFRNVQVSVLSQKKLSYTLFRPAQTLVVEETNRILDSVGLSEKKLDIAGSLSHGDKRVLEIAIALGNEPELLILDEPTAGMGVEESAHMVSMLRSLKGKQTLLLVEHDMDAVFALADRITVLVYGQVMATGGPDEIRSNPRVRDAYLGCEETSGVVHAA